MDEAQGPLSTASSEQGADGFAEFYRAHAGRLVAFLLARGGDLAGAAQIAHDTMAAVHCLTRQPGSGPRGASVGVRAPGLLDWAYRVAAGGMERWSAGAVWAEPVNPLLDPRTGAAPAHRRTAAVLAPLTGLNIRQRRVVALAMASSPPGAIGYELALPTWKVHRTLRCAGRLLRADPHDDLPDRLSDMLIAAADELRQSLDLDAGLARASGPDASAGAARVLPRTWGFDARLRVLPCGAPPLAGPPGTLGSPASALRAHAAELATRDARHRIVARGPFPAAELAAVRLGALFSCHLDRFRSDIRQSRYRSSAVVFTAADAHAFADALARDIACAAPMLDAASASGAARLAGRLAANAEHDDPRSDDIATDARDLAVALSGFRRGALELALRALPVDADGGVELAEALRPSVHGADRMTGELQSSNRARSGAGPGSAGDHRADPGLDLVVHAAFSSDLVHGIDAVQDALSDAVAADLRSAGLGGVPLEGVHWSEATRWPDGWEERIRHGSVLTAPGRCTVLPGR